MASKKTKGKRRTSADLFDDEPAAVQCVTPKRITTSNRSEDEDSPYFPLSTQETRDDVDVLWDYSSPKSKQETVLLKKKSRKKLPLLQSPKVPLVRHGSRNHDLAMQDFCKIRDEIRALRAEIAKPDHEESLILSPREEAEFKVPHEHPEEPPNFECDPDDPFNDDMDDKLVWCSQRLLNNVQTVNNNCDNDTSEKKVLEESAVFNDSFDVALSQVKDDIFNQVTQVVLHDTMYRNERPETSVNKPVNVFPRCQSDGNIQVKAVANKMEWHRTQSFESHNAGILRSQMEEMERKRLEAKAKLAKKKQELVSSKTSNNLSSPQCSLAEIEQKRLEALAKLEAKRQQELIEKNKQEALKRREENRRKRATQVIEKL